jgi:ABC-type Zn uptake system ZnuABC Zn-binding protein ZnuA
VRTRHRVAALAVAVAVTACGPSGDPAPSVAPDPEPTTAEATPTRPPEAPEDEPAEGPELVVVATLAPLADIVAQVLGDRGEVVSLIPSGVDSHTYEPRPGHVAPLTEADAFFGNGLDLNPAAVALAEANLPEGAPLVLLGDEALTADQLSDEHWHEHDGGEPHNHSHDDDGEPHTHDDDGDRGGVNPHVWTSVPNVLAYVEVVASTLVELDPDGADGYAERADAYRDELEGLDEAIRAAVDTLEESRRKLVVYHDAWAYFGREYGVEVVQPSDHAEPSASDVRAIIDQIRAEDVPAVFGAEEFPTSVTATIAEETGARYVGELADDSLPGAPGDAHHTYVAMMAENVARIVGALGGDTAPLDGLRP